MTEQAIQKRGKNNSKPDGPGPESQLPKPEAPAVRQIMAVIVPSEIFDQMKRAIKQLPYEDVELLLGTMKNLYPQQVTMSGPPGQG
jgi:hypothetical protein